MEFLRKYVAYAKRNYFPNLNEKAKLAIEEYYVNVRNDTAKQDRSAGAFENEGEKDRVIPITARAIEALIRLTEAHARMHLKQVADETDANVALAVYKHWRDDSGSKTSQSSNLAFSIQEKYQPKHSKDNQGDL